MKHENEDRGAGPVLDQLVDEARAATPEELARSAGIDWDHVDAALFARVDREAREARALASHRGRSGAWLLLGGVAAAAAAAAVMVQPSAHDGGIAPVSLSTAPGSAGDLTLQKGPGDVTVAGEKARAGALARAGEAVATRGARAVFEAPGRVSWLLEDESNVTVARAGAPGTPVILALRQGAVEAEVAPVASGEAFAVDIDGVRVAVHGTHLRVARDGDRVVVDLTEGVVSIGAPPKSGSTYGTLVTAPAHVEFQSDALATSLRVDHQATSVRMAADLDSVMDDDTTASVTPASRPAAPAEDHAAPQQAPQRAVSTASQRRPARLARNPNAEEDVASAVRACLASEPHSSDVTPRFDTTAKVTLYEDGRVNQVVFVQPLSPYVYKCATPKILGLRFVDSGEHTIPITF